MRYLRKFNENINNELEKIWNLNPYEFKDIILSSMEDTEINGSLEFIDFILTYPYPDSNGEKCVVFTMDGNTIKKGPYFNNLYSIIESERFKMGIEVFLNESDFNKLSNFHIEVNRHLHRADIPYESCCPNYKIGSLVPVEFTYNWSDFYKIPKSLTHKGKYNS